MFFKASGTAHVAQITVVVVIMTIVVIYQVLQFEVWLNNENNEVSVSSGMSGLEKDKFDANGLPLGSGVAKREKSPKKAAMVIVLRHNAKINEVLITINSFEQRFNVKYGHEWVIVLPKKMQPRFYAEVAAATSGGVRFIDIRSHTPVMTIPRNTDKAAVREGKARLKLPQEFKYMGHQNGKHLTRFLVGHFYNLHSLWNDFDYYWRVPAGSTLGCDVGYDVFDYMYREGIQYGWSLMLKDFDNMNGLLMPKAVAYMERESPTKRKSLKALQNEFSFLFGESKSESTSHTESEYRGCSFNTDFELVDVSFFRSKPYRDIMNFLDCSGGIYTQTWREPALKTILTTLWLEPKQIKQFDDLAVEYPTFRLSNCPVNESAYLSGNCSCNPARFDINDEKYSLPHTDHHMRRSQCVDQWLKFMELKRPVSFQGTADFMNQFVKD